MCAIAVRCHQSVTNCAELIQDLISEILCQTKSMGVYVRDDSPFFWFLLEGTNRRASTGVPIHGGSPAHEKELRRQAEDIYATKKADLARGLSHLPVKRDAILFSTFAAWYETHRVSNLRGKEREREIIATWVTTFTGRSLEELTRTRIEEAITKRAKSINPRTVNREVDTLKSMLKAAAALGHLAASPIAGMKRLKFRKPKRRTLTPAEETRLLKLLSPTDKAIVIMGLDTLCRLGDILDLKRSDDHGRYLYIADPKDPDQAEPYHVPVSKRLRKALDAVPKLGVYYFQSRRVAKTDRDRRGAVRQMLEAACATANIPYGRANGGITFHWATRRTGASRMLSRGANLKSVQKIGNWKRPDTVLDIYAESLTEDEFAAVELVSGSRHTHARAKTSRR